MGIFKQSKKAYKLAQSLKQLKSQSEGPSAQRAQDYINQILKSDGGIFEKVLQYMGTQNVQIEEIVYQNKSRIPASLVQEIWDKEFPASGVIIEEESYGASIGQVNKARLNDQEYAVKIRYPDIEQRIREQLSLINLLPRVQGVAPTKKWGFDFGVYQKTIESLLEQEINLENEAKALLHWGQLVKDIADVQVPRVHKDFISEGMYLQEYISGLSVREVSELPSLKEKRAFAERLAYAYLVLFFEHGRMQGDSNFGNFLFTKNDSNVFFIDLGQEIHFNPLFVNAIGSVLNAKIKGESLNVLGFYKDLGFDIQKLKPLHAKLPLLTEILLEPFICNRVYDLNKWNYKKEIDLLLGEDKWWFRSAGGKDFFLFMKSFMGLKNILNYWGVAVNWTQLILESIGQKSWDSLSKVEVEDFYLADYKGRNIRIKVLDHGNEKVKLTLPFMTVFTIDEYIDEDVRAQIEKQGISIKEVVQSALADGGEPKVLFELDRGKKHYHIAII